MATETMKMPSTVRKPVDIWLLGTVLLLVMIGLWMVFDTSYAKALDDPNVRGNAWYFVQRQAIVGAFGGFFALLFTWFIGYWSLKRFALIGAVVGVVLLALVWFPGVGVRLNNASRWIKLGSSSMLFQPSELAKLLLVFYLARIFSRTKLQEMKNFTETILPLLAAIGTYALLIEREPDLGTALVLLATSLTMLFMAGMRNIHMLGILAVLGAAMVLFVMGFSHRGNRMKVFMNPDKYSTGIGYQVSHARMAVGSGGWVGTGLGQGKEKYYLPQRDTDFIFATLAEETGFVGCMVVMSLITFVGLRGMIIAKQTQDPFARLVAVGISSTILWQAFINIAVATASIPATGIPLPFISYGSSSLFILMASIGILLSIAQFPLPPQALEPETPPVPPVKVRRK